MELSQRPILALSKYRLQQIHSHLTFSSLSSKMANRTLESLPKSQSFTKHLPADPRVPDIESAKTAPDELIHSARRLLSGFYTYVAPQPRKEYKFLLASPRALEDLGLDPATEPHDPNFQKIVTGEAATQPQYPYPYSQCYAGWQFGQFAGQLGDGRVVNLFEVANGDTRFELQLKGSGKTPFSRFADGKAVLRSSIREFVISESLNGIGIPSTRALALSYLPGTYAQRYGAEQCAIVCRMAETWIRIGTFDLVRMRGNRKEAVALADYVIEHVLQNTFTYESRFPEMELTKYDKMYFEIVARNAHTVAWWHAYGFLNGVLNTDNTSILGLSLDFGPFAFMDKFDLDYTSNHEDSELRYSFKNTPNAIWWNLIRLGEDLAELIGAGPDIIKDPAFGKEFKKEWEQPVISRAEKLIGEAGTVYEELFLEDYQGLMAKRLGVESPDRDFHTEVVSPLLDALHVVKLDYNQFFADLQKIDLASPDFDYSSAAKTLVSEVAEGLTAEEVEEELRSWMPIYKTKLEELGLDDTKRREVSSKYNPLFLPRNWILDEVIQAAQDSNTEDISLLDKLLRMSSFPYEPSKWGDDLKDVESRWLRPPEGEKSMLQCSCSS